MLALALEHKGPISIRYPKTNLDVIDRPNGFTPVEMGKAEVIEWGADGCFIAFGTLLSNCLAAARLLADEGIHVGVINARFVKPLDRETILRAVETLPYVATVEEGTIEGGFGSAVLEAANAAGLDTRNIVRLGLPDQFITHGDRAELLADLGLDPEGLAKAVRRHREAPATADSPV
jgi:1-deoxy-D-xylulose-5-phosphate synthase